MKRHEQSDTLKTHLQICKALKGKIKVNVKVVTKTVLKPTSCFNFPFVTSPL